MAIKLFISDLDGTLLKSGNPRTEEELNWSEEVSINNINGVEKLQKNNVKFGIATGRMLGQVEHVIEQIDNNIECVITQNGNYIYDQQLKLIKESCFNVRENLKIIKYIRDFGFKPFFLDKETIYIDLRYINYDNIVSLKEFYKNNYIQMLNWNNPWEIEHSTIRPGMVSIEISRLKESQKLDLANVIQEDLDFTKVSISSPFVIDIYPAKSSKYNAISEYIKLHDIKEDEVAYIGDSGNDVSCFEKFKYSYCMSHSRSDVKEHAAVIVDSVSDAIEHVLKINNEEN